MVRPYWLVDDIDATVAAAKKAGAVIALPPMNLPGHGTCAICVQGGIDHGSGKSSWAIIPNTRNGPLPTEPRRSADRQNIPSPWAVSPHGFFRALSDGLQRIERNLCTSKRVS